MITIPWSPTWTESSAPFSPQPPSTIKAVSLTGVAQKLNLPKEWFFKESQPHRFIITSFDVMVIKDFDITTTSIMLHLASSMARSGLACQVSKVEFHISSSLESAPSRGLRPDHHYGISTLQKLDLISLRDGGRGGLGKSKAKRISQTFLSSVGYSKRKTKELQGFSNKNQAKKIVRW